MSEAGQMKTSLGEQDYVLPQVYFPSVVTIKDPTEPEFIYVLNNVLRTRRYGAQNTRTGTVQNIVTAIVFADGEIFSNLQLCQAVYDTLSPEQRARMPLQRSDVLAAMESVVPSLLQEDGVVAHTFIGEVLERILSEVLHMTSDETQLRAVLAQANAEAQRYAETYGVFKPKSAKKQER